MMCFVLNGISHAVEIRLNGPRQSVITSELCDKQNENKLSCDER